MRNKRYILSFLFFISILMLVMPVIPHHHHADGMVCMKKDMPTETECPAHNHHQQDNDACCNDECQARFHSPALMNHVDFGQPQHVFVAILFDDFIVHHLFKPQEQRIKRNYAYRENLHGTNITRAFGLRAPPYAFA